MTYNHDVSDVIIGPLCHLKVLFEINLSFAPLFIILCALCSTANFCHFSELAKKNILKILAGLHNMVADGVTSPQLSRRAAIALYLQLCGRHPADTFAAIELKKY